MSWLAALVCCVLGGCKPRAGASLTPAPVTAEEAREIAADAYVYAYPLVLMEITRRVSTNVAEPDAKSGRAPMNQLVHLTAFPDATFTTVVRPNADTLYSVLWFDVGEQPLVIDVPDSGGRYYLLPTLDLWTDVFSSTGKRTTGTAAQTIALVGPRYGGTLPKGVTEIRSPTAVGWMIGRTQTNGAADYEAVHRFQEGLRATPLSEWGSPAPTPRKGRVDPTVSPRAPVEQIAGMDGRRFFALFAELTADNPPHESDHPILARMERIGLHPGRALDVALLPPEHRAAIDAAPASGMKKILGAMARLGALDNGWRIPTSPMGTYGTDYLRRAVIAYAGLGANVLEDAIYPTAFEEPTGKSFDSGAKYTVHFDPDQIPPVNAFWSLTMYDDRQLFADNPLQRFAIGDRDKLRFNPDGSLDLHIQRESPGQDREPNWLPAPKKGAFTMTLRLYWPKPAALDGRWAPPRVTRVDGR